MREKRQKDVLVLTNAIMDILKEVSEEELSLLELKKGVVNDQRKLYSNKKFQELAIDRHSWTMIPGGSPANVAHTAVALGLKSGMIGTIGEDDIGRRYQKDARQAGIEDRLTVKPGESGLCYLFITPDKEKTPVPDLKAAKHFEIDFDVLKDYKIFHTSGYELITNPPKVIEALEAAKQEGLKISFDMGDPIVPRVIRGAVDKALTLIDYLTLTEKELKAYTGRTETAEAIKDIQGLCEIIVVKKGGKGSEIMTTSDRYHIPIFDVKVKDTTGAGDALSAGLLYGVLNSFDLKKTGYISNFLGAMACSCEGARIKNVDMKLFEEYYKRNS